MPSSSALENLAGPGGALGREAPDVLDVDERLVADLIEASRKVAAKVGTPRGTEPH